MPWSSFSRIYIHISGCWTSCVGGVDSGGLGGGCASTGGTDVDTRSAINTSQKEAVLEFDESVMQREFESSSVDRR